MQAINNIQATHVQNTITDMKIVSMTLQASGIYKPQCYRPLTMMVNNDDLANLGRVVDQANGRLNNLDLSSFSKTLTPSEHSLGTVHIPNGWDTERYTFEMRVMISSSAGMVEETLIGWSEYKDTSLNGLPDPEMYFTVNSVTRRRINTIHNASGTHSNYVVDSASQIFFEPEYGSSFNNETTPKLIRPYDMYGRLAVGALDPTAAWTREFGTGFSGPGTLLDSRGSITGVPETSRRTNNLSESYLSRTLNAYANANIAHETGMTEASYTDFGSIYSDARKQNSIREIPVSESDFLKRLNNCRMSSPVVMPMFTLKELYTLDPALANSSDQRLCINNQSIQTNMFAGSAWNTGSPTAIAAFHLAHAIPAILARMGGMGLSVMIQNVRPYDPRVMVTGQLELTPQNVILIEAAIENEVMPMLTMNNARCVDVKFTTNSLALNSTIVISLNGEPEEIFDVPQFADARFSPIISSETNAADMASMLSVTLQHVGVPISTDFGTPAPLDLQKIMLDSANESATQLNLPSATLNGQMGNGFNGFSTPTPLMNNLNTSRLI